jgi:prepilin signal peptidase PulO-like enzyme (type II secretory pathway)
MPDPIFILSQITGRRLPAVDTSGLAMIQWVAAVNIFIFVFAFGAIVGSFLNVVVYRLPRGLNLVSPPSACPHCGTRLTWRENVPILGWLLLRGRCRFCRSPISAEYPIVETLVAVLFSLIYVLWFMEPHLPGLDPRWWGPGWALDGFWRTSPTCLLMCLLLASLVAITLIDARSFTIPIAIPWLMAGTALVVHPLHALVISWLKPGTLRNGGHEWVIPTVSGPWLAAALAAGVGLVISNVLLSKGWLKRSFSDYEAWEKANHPNAGADAPVGTDDANPVPAATESSTGGEAGLPMRYVLLRTLFLTGPAIAGMFAGFSIGLKADKPLQGMGIGMLVGLLIGLLLRRLVKDPEGTVSGDPVWVQYPHARREMIRELAFLAPAGVLAWAAFALVPGTSLGEWLDAPPLWMAALGGSVMGLLVGGGVVWAIRILGTLGLGKEAMGLGDVHLMAGVGAILGWIDPTIAFFVAPFFGLGWAVLGIVAGRLFKRHGTALPYGPHLAAATVLVVFLKPVVEMGLTALMGRPIDLP